jgi:hypothetical protein
MRKAPCKKASSVLKSAFAISCEEGHLKVDEYFEPTYSFTRNECEHEEAALPVFVLEKTAQREALSPASFDGSIKKLNMILIIYKLSSSFVLCVLTRGCLRGTILL